MCPLSSDLYPPSFIFFFSSRTFQQPHLLHIREERKREGEERKKAGSDCQKDKAGGDRRSPCSTTTFAAPPSLVLLPTIRLGQIDLFFLFFFHICLFCEKQHREREYKEKKKSRGERKNWYNSSWNDFLIKRIQLLMYSSPLELMSYCS